MRRNSDWGRGMNLRFLDWIWHIRGSLPLTDGLTADDAFKRLDPLFKQQGTDYLRDQNVLTFTKKDQAAQDKMSIFDGGQLMVEAAAPRPALLYNLKSRALLACFLAPLVFLAFAQFSAALNLLHESSASVERSADEADAETEEEEEAEEIRLHPIDRFLGAPAPKQPGEDDDDVSDDAARAGSNDAETEEAEEEEDRKHSSRPAYVFAGIFALIYLVGRFLEAWLIRRRFTELLATSTGQSPSTEGLGT